MTLKKYKVGYLIGGETFYYRFDAEDEDHARDQFEDAEPDYIDSLTSIEVDDDDPNMLR